MSGEFTPPRIKDEAQYQKVQQYVKNLGDDITKQGGWLDPAYREHVLKYNRLAGSLLNYETEHNLLPI